ncbi:serine/threonine protein kinase [Streptomyces smyrnaeus]|uniref:Serine/threonine protein kinase n=1 Tax=Streptomyces smyrnaeus TaxID=1387713 RepID=A0ABS3XXU4_9ACTN|nr:serine/threonine-protein kinase [Streptomyces smyrnaeus]MBO8200209.1 serine/threonine protein kinase [Streptomyces smyrnaeus]
MTDGAAAEVFTPLAQDDPASVAGYRLAARLGSGGMGKVYLSYTPGGRPVAIKVIRPDFSEDPEFRRRFQQEVRAAERVQGLYTAPVIDSDTEGPRPWLATAYVPGPSVAEAVAAHGRLPVPTVLFLVAGIAEALQVIHKAGIVHRDLKPSNVLLADDGPRVIDFGIARAADATSLTSSGATIGTPSFMAPEQAAGERVTEATDIFALGQIAAYAAAGTPAFGEGTSHGVLYRIVHAEPALDGVPDELRELVTRCLAKDPADRPGLPEVLGMCRTASGDTELRRAGDWLPAAVASDITHRAAAPAPSQSPPPTQAAAPAASAQSPTRTAGPAPGADPSAGAAGTAPLTAQVPPPPRSAGPQTPPPAPPLAAAPTMAARPVGPQHPAPPPGGPHPPAGYLQPRPPGPVGPYPPVHPRPLPPRRRWDRGKTIAAVVVGGMVLFWGGLYALGSGGEDGSDASSGGSSAAGKGAKDPNPEPVAYKGINLSEGYFLAMADDPLKPRDLDDSDTATPSELTYLDTTIDGAELSIDEPNGKLVLLNNSQKGSLKTCRAETRFTDSVKLNQLSPGSRLCVRTSSGHLALVTYRGHAPESDPSNYVKLDVTVWRNAIEATDD